MSEKKEKKEKKQNRPHILDRAYTEKQLNKKILSKIEVPEDRALMKSLFVKGLDPKNPELYAAPKVLDLDKKELNRIRSMAKEIHTRSKSRINFVPLIAVLVFVFALVFVTGLFKNTIAKNILVSVLQGVFSAKTDVEKVNVGILSSSINVKGLAIGNKDSVMKNLFEADVIEVDFNLTQLLRGKFHAENLEASGMAFNTDRATSCELPKKEKKESSSLAENEFVKRITAQLQEELDSLKAIATDLLGGDDVESMVKNLEASLKTPSAVESGISEVTALVENWKSAPGELSAKVVDFSKSVSDLQTIDVSKIQDEKVLRDALVKITKALAQGNTLKTSVESTVEKVKSDGDKVRNISSSVLEAASADKKMASDRLTAIVDTASNAKSILTNAIDSLAYSAVGKAYPFAKKVISFAEDVKESAAMEAARKVLDANKKVNDKAKSITKPKRERLKGQTFWYSTESPAFLIEHALASGPDFSAEASEISSNPNLRGNPCTLTANYQGGGVNHHADLVLDARTNTNEPLLSIDYSGQGFNLLVNGSDIAEKSGVPSVDGKASLSLHGAAGNGIFKASGNVDLKPVSLSSDGFASEHMTRYYNQALSTINNMNLGYAFTCRESSGMDLTLNGNFAELFAKAMATVVNSIGSDAKKVALDRIQSEINDSSNQMALKAKEFFGIEGEVNLENTKLSDLQNILDQKKKDIEAKLQARANEAVENAKQQAGSAVKSAIQQSLGTDDQTSEKAADKLQNATGNMLKGIMKK